MTSRNSFSLWWSAIASATLALGPVAAQDGPLPIHPEKLKQLQKRIDAGERAQDLFPKLVEIQVEFYALPHVELTNLLGDITLLRDGDRLKQKLEELAKEKKAWLSASSLLSTTSGERKKVSQVVGWSTPVNWDAPFPALEVKEDGRLEPTVVPTTPSEFGSSNYGLELECDPVIEEGNDAVSCNLGIQLMVRLGESSMGEGVSKITMPETGIVQINAASSGHSDSYQFSCISRYPSLKPRNDEKLDLRVVTLWKPRILPLVPPGLNIPENKPNKRMDALRQVSCLAEWIEVDVREVAEQLGKTTQSSEASELFQRCKVLIGERKARAMETAAIKLPSGQHTTVNSGMNVQDAASYSPAEIRPRNVEPTPSKHPLSVIPARPSPDGVRTIGIRFEIDPVIGEDNFTVDLNAAPTITEWLGEQTIGEDPAGRVQERLCKVQQLSHSVTMFSGDCLLAGIFHPASQQPTSGVSNSQKRILLFYRTIVDGQPIALEPEAPLANPEDPFDGTRLPPAQKSPQEQESAPKERITQLAERLQKGESPLEVLPKLVEIELEYYTLPHEELAKLFLDIRFLRDGDRLKEELVKLAAANKAWMSASTAITTKFGQRGSISDCLQWRYADGYYHGSTALQELEPGKVETITAPPTPTGTNLRNLGLELETEANRGENSQISLNIRPELTFHLGDAAFGQDKMKIVYPQFGSLNLKTQVNVWPGSYCFLGILKSPEELLTKPAPPHPVRNLRVIALAKASTVLCAPRGLNVPPLPVPNANTLMNTHLLMEYFEVEKAAAEEMLAKGGGHADATAQLNYCRELLRQGRASRVETFGISGSGEERSTLSSFFEQPNPDDSKKGPGGLPMNFIGESEKPFPPPPDNVYPAIPHPAVKRFFRDLGTQMGVDLSINEHSAIDVRLEAGLSSWAGDQVFGETPLSTKVRPIIQNHPVSTSTMLLNGGCVLLEATTPPSSLEAPGNPLSHKRILVFLRAIASVDPPQPGNDPVDGTQKAGLHRFKPGLPQDPIQFGRNDEERTALLAAHGGSPECEAAIVKSLDWFAKAQNADGSWGKEWKAGMTGLVLLGYFGHCETTGSPRYGDKILKAITYLLDVGKKNNGFLTEKLGNSNHCVYEHGIACWALAEAYSFAKPGKQEIPGLLDGLTKATEIILDHQQDAGDWAYGGNSPHYVKYGREDMSVTGWQFQALRAVARTGVKVREIKTALTKTGKYLQSRSQPEGGIGHNGAHRDAAYSQWTMSGIGALGLQTLGLAGQNTADKAIAFILAETAKNPLDWKKNGSLYSWFYNTEAIYLKGGKDWETWNGQCRDQILQNQRPDGSYNPEFSEHRHATSAAAGPDAEIYRAALCTRMLEIYYRYRSVIKN